MEENGNQSPGNRRFTKGVDVMIPMIEPVLYLDPQQAVPVWFCECCGAELYSPGTLCEECEEEP
jgi:hypothetical protein